MVMLTDLADGLRKHGLTVIEVPGWRTRGFAGRGFYGTPKGVVHHHTATTSARTWATGAPTLNMLTHGRSDLPGPLCNIALGRGGEVYVVAAGWANHAGSGGPIGGVPRDLGNGWLLGIEAESSGVAPADWTSHQIRVWPYLAAALAKAYGGANPDTWLQIAHYEWSNQGKIDPALVPGRIEGLRSAAWYARTQGRHAWSYANPTGAPALSSGLSSAVTQEQEWSDMATEAEIRKIVREEVERGRDTMPAWLSTPKTQAHHAIRWQWEVLIRRALNAMVDKEPFIARQAKVTAATVLGSKIGPAELAKGEITLAESLAWDRHHRALNESQNNQILQAIAKRGGMTDATLAELIRRVGPAQAAEQIAEQITKENAK